MTNRQQAADHRSILTSGTNTAAQNERLEAAMEEVVRLLEVDKPLDREALLAKYPDVAEALSACLCNLDFVQHVAPQLADRQASTGIDQTSNTQPTNLGDFRILCEIGRGGMGVVYEAEQLSLDRRMALKVLPFAAMLDKQQLKRFKNEARAAATLDHPNIVAVHSVGEDRGVHYYAMQLVEGQSLAEVIAARRESSGLRARTTGASDDSPTIEYPSAKRSPAEGQGGMVAAKSAETRPIAKLSTIPAGGSQEYFRAVARLGIQAAQALDHAHQSGIVHRDIKPGNLLVDAEGKLYVTDFGLARIEADAGVTMTGDLLGTLAYMSPEQALAKRVVVDHRTDVYSLGVTLYELITLQKPYEGRDRQELLKKIAFDEPRRLRQINSRIPRELETIVAKAMEKSPDERYATAQDLANDLCRFLADEPIQAKPPTFLQRTGKWTRRHQAFVATAAVVMALLLVGASVSTVLVMHAQSRTQAALEDAQQQRQQAESAAAESKALVEFFVGDLLGASDPEVAQGNDVTVQDVVAEAERRLESDFADQPLLQAAIWRALGKIHMSLGEDDLAEPQLRRALKIQQDVLGTTAETLETMSVLGQALSGQDHIKDAADLIEKTLNLKRQTLGEEHPDTLKELTNWGSVLSQQEQLTRAKNLLEQSLQAHHRVLGKEDDESLRTQELLAGIHFSQGDYGEGRRLLDEVVEISERAHGTLHPLTLKHRMALASALKFRRIDEQAAFQTYQQILPTASKVYGPFHPVTQECLCLLARSYADLGQRDRALELYKPNYERIRSELGEQHPRTLTAAVQWAKLLSLQGEVESARQVLEQVLEARRQTLGPDRKSTVHTYHDLAEVHWQNQAWDEAVHYSELHLEHARRSLGDKSDETISAMLNLGNALAVMDDLERGGAILEEARALANETLGPAHPTTLEATQLLARVAGKQEDFPRLETLLRQAYEASRLEAGDKNGGTLILATELIPALCMVGKQEEAAALGKRTLAAYDERYGPDYHPTLEQLDLLGNFLYRNDSFAVAAQLNATLTEVLRDFIPADHRVLHRHLMFQGLVLARLEQWSKAQEMFQECFDIRRRTLGMKDLETLNAAHALSQAYRGAGKLQQASESLQEALPAARRHHPESDVLLRLMHIQGLILKDLEQFGEAEEIFVEAIAMGKRVFGEDHPDALTSMRALSIMLAAQDRRGDAYRLDQEVGVLRYKAGRWGQASYTFGEALQNAQTPQERAASGFYHAAALWQQHKPDAAKAAFATAEENYAQAEADPSTSAIRAEAVRLIERGKENSVPAENQPEPTNE